MSDDTFIEAHVDPARKMIVREAVLTSTPPQNFRSYIRVRARWERGLWQLQRMGIHVQRSPNQKRAVVSMLLKPRYTLPGLIYFVAKLLGLALAAKATWAQEGWYTDTTSRSDGGNKA
jgi:cellulose synthase/poly-beta-1,6-N-acetylglucosamine synthase-like glycosyltransferase